VSCQSARVNFGWSLARTDSSRGWPPSYFELISIHYENGCLRCVPCPRRIVGVRWRQRAALGAGPDLNPELRFRVPRSSFAWAGFSVSQKLSPLQLSSSRALRTKNSQQSGPSGFLHLSAVIDAGGWPAFTFSVKVGMTRPVVRVATIHQWGKDEIKFARQAA
jgi:hypothetical protein